MDARKPDDALEPAGDEEVVGIPGVDVDEVELLAPGPGPLGLFDTNLGFVGPSFSLAMER